ncbi:hypothetical protein BJX66DRAFT_289304 [Aspergillus keveii]|uniref:Uncharacterized protein n=1 Tax=Aspergillus keveii TaxID=714993 RepID=A0ABR4GQ67_9EURO
MPLDFLLTHPTTPLRPRSKLSSPLPRVRAYTCAAILASALASKAIVQHGVEQIDAASASSPRAGKTIKAEMATSPATET